MENKGHQRQRGKELHHLNKFIFFIVPLLIVSISCKSKRYKEIEYLLAGDEYKYWRLDSIDSPSEFCYYRNYTYDRFFFNQKLKTRHKSGNPYGDDVLIGLNTWGIINDSTILMNENINYLILSLTENHVVLLNKTVKDKEILFLYKSPEQEILVTPDLR